MKRVISLDELVSSEISPKALYSHYTKLITQDIRELFRSKPALQEVLCPGCGKKGKASLYKKMGMTFKSCPDCGSIYVSPRPSADQLRVFYEKSSGCRHWRKEILSEREPHLQHIHWPRIHWIMDLVDEFLPSADSMLDYQSKYPFFLEKIVSQKIFKNVAACDDLLLEQRNLSGEGIKFASSTEVRAGQWSVMTAFDSLERMANPDLFFQLAKRCCASKGLLLMTTATSSGFEYQVLGEAAPNINPINRMNLLSLEAIQKKIKAAGFEILELSTPGRLDAEIVKNTLANQPNLKIDPFWKYVFKHRGDETVHSLQEFLQLNQLSSHVRIAAQKKV